MSLDCPNLAENKANCPCTNVTCDNNGKCCACVTNHKKAGNLPACLKS